MTALQIMLTAAGGVLVLCFLLLFCTRARLRVTYQDGISCTLSILFVKRRLVTKKEHPAPPPLRDLTDCKNPEEEIERDWARQHLALQKAAEQRAKENAKKAKKAERKAGKTKDFPKLALSEILPMLSDIVKGVFRATKGKFRMKIHRLDLAVASEDAATTALLYGSVSGALSALLDFLDQNRIRVKIAKGGIRIEPDYLSDKPRVDLSVTLSTTLWRALRILSRSGGVIASARAKAGHRAKARLAKKESSAEASADNINQETQKG